MMKLAKGTRAHPLKWVLPDEYDRLASPNLLKQLIRLAEGKRFTSNQLSQWLRQWLDEVSQRRPDGLFTLECLAWCHALPRLGPLVCEAQWRSLLACLEELARAASGAAPLDDPVSHQLLGGELPLSLAYLFPEIQSYRDLAGLAKAALSFGIVELSDGEGLLNARHIDRSRSLLACWTRCALMESGSAYQAFDKEARHQFLWSVRQALRLSRADGTLVLSSGLSGDWCADLFQAALRTADDPLDQKVARLVLPGQSLKVSDRQMRKLPEPPVYSEWSEVCVMRPKWSRKSPQFTCLFSDRQLRTELSTAGRVIWSGRSDPEVRIDDQPLSMRSDWTELCWYTDEDVDYLELEAEYEGGWMLQRQMLLARSDHFLMMADAILGPRAADIQYLATLPLADDIKFQPDGATREGYLTNSRPLCTVIPLSLPEWKSAPALGSLESEKNRLHLRLRHSSQRLYAPLFIDLVPRRATDRRTWRQLTVTQELALLTHDVAVGYRVQFGRKQWLIYRSLAPRSSRSVLGQNLSHEFVCARFDLDGGVDELIEIE